MKTVYEQFDDFRRTGLDSARRSAALMLEGFAELMKHNVDTAEQVCLVGTREMFEAASKPNLAESAARLPAAGTAQWQRGERIMQAYLQWAGNIQEQMAKAYEEQFNALSKPMIQGAQEALQAFLGVESENRAPGRPMEAVEPKIRRQAA